MCEGFVKLRQKLVHEKRKNKKGNNNNNNNNCISNVNGINDSSMEIKAITGMISQVTSSMVSTDDTKDKDAITTQDVRNMHTFVEENEALLTDS